MGQLANATETPRRVLVVDDNIDAAETLSMFLDLIGQRTAVANSGADSLRIAADFAPEIVFLDLGMPGMSGFEVARALRSIPALERAYIVALTGWGDQQTRDKTKEAGFDLHLTKPADFNTINLILNGLER